MKRATPKTALIAPPSPGTKMKAMYAPIKEMTIFFHGSLQQTLEPEIGMIPGYLYLLQGYSPQSTGPASFDRED